ncbi:MAG: WYL domain-containing protein, partial [Thermodesulfovibrio sp.]|nr:WYL domain-containing protein [Thermodesulfovibrio sp.]
SAQYDSEVFRIVMEALTNQRTLKIVYESTQTRKVTEREIDPYELYFHDGEWLAYSYCHLRKGYRWFALDGIRQIELTDKNFIKPDDFSLEKQLEKSFYILEAYPVVVKVRFLPEIAHKIKRKKRFHKIEQREELQDGSILITFEVAGLLEIKRWLYTFIPHFEVIEPEELRDMIKRELEIIIEKIK